MGSHRPNDRRSRQITIDVASQTSSAVTSVKVLFQVGSNIQTIKPNPINPMLPMVTPRRLENVERTQLFRGFHVRYPKGTSASEVTLRQTLFEFLVGLCHPTITRRHDISAH